MRISFLKYRVPDLPELGIPVVQKMRILGVIFSDRLTWDDHISHLISQIIPLLRSLAKLWLFNLSKDVMLTYYKTYMRPILDAYPVWHACLPSLGSLPGHACPVWHAGLKRSNQKN